MKNISRDESSDTCLNGVLTHPQYTYELKA
jgi:hypothetical protein